MGRYTLQDFSGLAAVAAPWAPLSRVIDAAHRDSRSPMPAEPFMRARTAFPVGSVEYRALGWIAAELSRPARTEAEPS